MVDKCLCYISTYKKLWGSNNYLHGHLPELFAYWEFLHPFFCRLLIFNQHFRKLFSGIPFVSNNWDHDRARHVCLPDLDPICLRKLSADDTCLQRRLINNDKCPCFTFFSYGSLLGSNHCYHRHCPNVLHTG